MALTPWPAEGAERTAAIDAVYRAVVSPRAQAAYQAAGDKFGNPGAGGASAEQKAVIARIAAAVSERVEFEATAAPQAVKDEALIRATGYLYSVGQHGWGALRAVEHVYRDGSLSSSVAMDVAPAMLRSGARALLRPWAKRRAGAI